MTRRSVNGRVQAKTLLLEIGTEELPPRALRQLGAALGAALYGELRSTGLLVEENGQFQWFAAPRRLGVRIPNVFGKQPDRNTERRGPGVNVAFDTNGAPTKAAIGFAASCGVELDELQRHEDEKGAWLVYRQRQRGLTVGQLLPGCVRAALQALPIPRRMRWGAGQTEFVRPVHWAVLMHGKRVIKTELLSMRTGNCTYGHRFHAPDALPIDNADDYPEILTKYGFVMADFTARAQTIRKQVTRLATTKGGIVGSDESLLDEVTGLVEWPVAILGTIDDAFMDIPAEMLISAMRDHQKYFHVCDKDGVLLPYFISVCNIKSRSPRRVRSGNERVLRARLADARFFWDTDRKTPLSQRLGGLRNLSWHNSLGSFHEKSERLAKLATEFALITGADADATSRAAILCKADLVTDAVGEFPELQGVMGGHYARHDGEPEAVATAIAEHYKPRYGGDSLPITPGGRALAIADKLDTLVGLFAAGEEPRADKDPYALRRVSLSVLRLLVEATVDTDLRLLVESTVRVFNAAAARIPDPDTRRALNADTADKVLEFILDRLPSYYAARGYAADEIAAVSTTTSTALYDFDQRLQAVAEFRKHEAATSLAAANKRIRNILRQADYESAQPRDRALRLQEPAEQHLANAIDVACKEVEPLLRTRAYTKSLARLAALREPVDRFFDEVMVMAEDPDVRRNRLALLHDVGELFLRIADVSRLQNP
ncbi:MAG: glycine--tRNA ligase subunit beta [Gammaproteobacteria bacterium]|nr:glycine--tRNA ligase subunit beta [Gammaproteobacteria bacterium]MDH3464431.1 glycine--tRNA ligase subunit beta [Gammaproteobacteria bacterium]